MAGISLCCSVQTGVANLSRKGLNVWPMARWISGTHQPGFLLRWLLRAVLQVLQRIGGQHFLYLIKPAARSSSFPAHAATGGLSAPRVSPACQIADLYNQQAPYHIYAAWRAFSLPQGCPAAGLFSGRPSR